MQASNDNSWLESFRVKCLAILSFQALSVLAICVCEVTTAEAGTEAIFTVMCSVTWPMNESEADGDRQWRNLIGSSELRTFAPMDHFRYIKIQHGSEA